MASKRAVPFQDPSQDNLPLTGTLDFMRLVWAIDHGLHITSKRMKASLGVTSPQRLVLRIVGRMPGVSAGQLARILHSHPSTLTGVLRRLVDAGLLRRKAAETDARRAVLNLTLAGRRVDSCRTGTVESAIQRALGASDPKDVAAARRVLVSLAASLGVQDESPEAAARSRRRR